jgi:hypothetical protein
MNPPPEVGKAAEALPVSEPGFLPWLKTTAATVSPAAPAYPGSRNVGDPAWVRSSIPAKLAYWRIWLLAMFVVPVPSPLVETRIPSPCSEPEFVVVAQ